jgi:CAAX protease family protein
VGFVAEAQRSMHLQWQLEGKHSPTRMNTYTPGRKIFPFIIYLIAFNATWIVWVYAFYPRIQAIGERTLDYALLNLIVRSLVWVLPVFLYIRYIDGMDPVKYLKLKQHWKRGVIVGLLLTGLNFLGSLVRLGMPHPSLNSMTWNSIFSTSILIGFFEEVPYRGFILQKCQERVNFWVANLISSLLFLGIHLPGWISLHMLRVGNVVVVFTLGFIMAIVFRYTKSLWSAIITHSLNDFLSAVVFGG